MLKFFHSGIGIHGECKRNPRSRKVTPKLLCRVSRHVKGPSVTSRTAEGNWSCKDPIQSSIFRTRLKRITVKVGRNSDERRVVVVVLYELLMPKLQECNVFACIYQDGRTENSTKVRGEGGAQGFLNTTLTVDVGLQRRNGVGIGNPKNAS
jgi:hypothetical protein